MIPSRVRHGTWRPFLRTYPIDERQTGQSPHQTLRTSFHSDPWPHGKLEVSPWHLWRTRRVYRSLGLGSASGLLWFELRICRLLKSNVSIIMKMDSRKSSFFGGDSELTLLSSIWSASPHQPWVVQLVALPVFSHRWEPGLVLAGTGSRCSHCSPLILWWWLWR